LRMCKVVVQRGNPNPSLRINATSGLGGKIKKREERTSKKSSTQNPPKLGCIRIRPLREDRPKVNSMVAQFKAEKGDKRCNTLKGEWIKLKANPGREDCAFQGRQLKGNGTR